jgi:hypothetical protein
MGRGGNTSNYSVPIKNDVNCASSPIKYCLTPSPGGCVPTNMTGGIGGCAGRYTAPVNRQGGRQGGSAIGKVPGNCSQLTVRNPANQPGVAIFSPYPLANPASQAVRSGAGGGSGSFRNNSTSCSQQGAGGGGGGGRGNAGNAGGCGGAGGTGGAGTPTTFNCVPVSPGTTTPITVGSPGGQIVISWNPQ